MWQYIIDTDGRAISRYWRDEFSLAKVIKGYTGEGTLVRQVFDTYGRLIQFATIY